MAALAHGDVHRPGGAGEGTESDPLVVDLHRDPLAPVGELKVERGQLVGEERVEAQHVASRFDAGVATLEDVDAAGHGAEVDTLPGGAALDVGDVTAQRLPQQRPRAAPVAAGQHPGVGDPGQGGAVGGAGQVVVDVDGDVGGIETVAEPVQEGGELFSGEEVGELTGITSRASTRTTEPRRAALP